MGSTIIVGGFFGDEGKGKIVAHIAFADKPTIIARGGIGPNAAIPSKSAVRNSACA